MKRPILLPVVGMLILIALLYVVASGSSSAGNHPSPDFSPAGLGNPADVMIHGAYLPPIVDYGKLILAFDDLVEKDLGIIHYFVGWYVTSWWFLPGQIETQVPAERRPQILLSWVPIGRDCRTMSPTEEGDPSIAVSLYDIVDGYCDGYVRHMAGQLRDLPFTFLLRFGPEMNLRSDAENDWRVGNPQLYIDAYRRICDLFAAEGITNVQWVWSPSYASSPREEWNSPFNYYPGDGYVDWIGIVAFNWAEWLGVPWWSLTELLDAGTWDHVLPEMMCRYAKPILLELGTVDGTRPGDGTKEGWIQDGYQALDQYPFVKAVVWFNDWDRSDPSRADFRMVATFDVPPYVSPLPPGDGRWTEGYKAAIARDRFISYLPPLEEITPPTTWCGGEPVFETLDAIYARPGETRTFTISVVGLMEDVDISLNGLPPEVSAVLDQPFLLRPWDRVQVRLGIGPEADLGASDITISFTSSGSTIEQVGLTLIVADVLYRAHLPLVSK